MIRKFYPNDTLNRLLFWASFVLILWSISYWLFRYDTFKLFIPDIWVIISALLGSTGLIFSYYLQDIPSQSESNEYTKIISDIKEIGDRLSKLNKFLELEQKRVADTKIILNDLNDEKTELEPIVISQRQTVDAILAAHSKRTMSNIWKERIISFILGIITSYIATILYSLFNH
jgi:hypothetical protein